MAGDQLAQLLGVGAAALLRALGERKRFVDEPAQRLDVGEHRARPAVDDGDPLLRVLRDLERLLGDAAVLGGAESVQPLAQRRELVVGERLDARGQCGELVAASKVGELRGDVLARVELLAQGLQLVAAGEVVTVGDAVELAAQLVELVAAGDEVDALVERGQVVAARPLVARAAARRCAPAAPRRRRGRRARRAWGSCRCARGARTRRRGRPDPRAAPRARRGRGASRSAQRGESSPPGSESMR